MALRVLSRIGISVAVAFVVLISWIAWSFHFGIDADVERFEADVWKARANVYAVSNDPGCVRGGMAVDLLERKLLGEKTMDEVYVLLGKPDKSENFSIAYELGQCSGFGWDSSVLTVRFDENRKVNRANIKRDIP